MRCPKCGGEEFTLVYSEKKRANAMRCPVDNGFMGWKSLYENVKDRERVNKKRYYTNNKEKLLEHRKMRRKEKNMLVSV
jgi:hypothetical protein